MKPELLEKFNASFDTPTPIQSAVWQRLTDGDSIFGLAPTGTGKTLAFVLPVLSRIDTNLKRTQVLILAPSQELAMQTTQVAREWGNVVGASVASLIGGANGRRQADKIKKDKPHIVVGTLGRVLTMVDGGVLKLDHIATVIFDEADAMLTEERHDSLQELADKLPSHIQLGLFSATSGVDLNYVSDTFEQKVHPISVGTDAPVSIKHEFQYVDQRAKEKVLIQLARNNQQALVFFNTISALELFARFFFLTFVVGSTITSFFVTKGAALEDFLALETDETSFVFVSFVTVFSWDCILFSNKFSALSRLKLSPNSLFRSRMS